MSDPTLPTHIDPDRDDRIAYAPYNFVPLPEHVVSAELPLPDFDVYHAERYTGGIECVLTTESPLYVRCALTTAQFNAAEQEKTQDNDGRDYRTLAKNTPDFFYTQSPESPVIPGSSLRGMLRALVEIASYGNVERVTNRKLFYRTVDNTRIGLDYRDRMIGKVQGGYLKLNGREASIEECRVYKVDRTMLVANGENPDLALYDAPGNNPRHPNRTPAWQRQYRTVWVKVYDFTEGFGRVDDIRLQQPNETGWTEGQLVITGGIVNKKHEFVFVRVQNMKNYAIDEAEVTRFHDDDQITIWQRRAFPRNRPTGANRARKGMLDQKQEQPIFFVLDEREPDRVEFFGRAQMFRLPYRNAPRDLVPSQFREEKIDIAQAIFGLVPQSRSDTRPVVAGRISVSDGILAGHSGELWLADLDGEPVTPRILSGPKPTTFQHYLTQDKLRGRPRGDSRDELSHYDSTSGQTTIRGSKLYWHRGEVERNSIEDSQFLARPEAQRASDTQHTQFRPVAAGVRFRFDIHFENLSSVELGAILWVLQLVADESYRLKLGMGKPLGMGSIKLTHTLYRILPENRYATLLDEDGWVSGKTAFDGTACVEAFEQYVLNHSEEALKGYTKLSHTLRIRCLCALLAWHGPERARTEYMPLEQFRRRPVLPTPLQVIGEAPLSQTAMPSTSQAQRPPAQSGGALPPMQSKANVQPDPQSARPLRLPAIGDIITGQRARQAVTLRFKGERKKVVAITPNKTVNYTLPRNTVLEIYADDQITGGGFYGQVIDIDDSEPRTLVLLVKREKRPQNQ